MSVLYCTICFSPFVPDVKARVAVGYACCLIVSIHLAVNLYLILRSMVISLKTKARLWYALQRQIWQRQQNRIKIKLRKHALKDAILSFNEKFHEEVIHMTDIEDSSQSSLEIVEEESSS